MDPGEPDIIAIHDQAQAEVIQSARVVAAYWTRLRSEGVEPFEALQLTLAFQRRLIFDAAAVDPLDDDAV